MTGSSVGGIRVRGRSVQISLSVVFMQLSQGLCKLESEWRYVKNTFVSTVMTQACSMYSLRVQTEISSCRQVRSDATKSSL